MAETIMESVLPVSAESNQLVLQKLAQKSLPQLRMACIANNPPADVRNPGEVCPLALEKIAEQFLMKTAHLQGISVLEPYAAIMLSKNLKGNPNTLASDAINEIVRRSIHNINAELSEPYNAKTSDGQPYTLKPTKAVTYDAGFLDVLSSYISTGKTNTYASIRKAADPVTEREGCFSKTPTPNWYNNCGNAGARHAQQLIDAFQRKYGTGAGR